MADIELVIKIPEEAYKASHDINTSQIKFIQMPLKIIANGIPLPKVHGDLIDRDELLKQPMDLANCPSNYVMVAHAIIEAERED